MSSGYLTLPTLKVPSQLSREICAKLVLNDKPVLTNVEFEHITVKSIWFYKAAPVFGAPTEVYLSYSVGEFGTPTIEIDKTTLLGSIKIIDRPGA